VAIILHWLITVLVLANIALGLAFTNSPAAEQGVSPLPPLHKSIGLTVLLLSVLRLIWRLTHRPPPPLQPFPLLARAVHWAFYLLLIAVPLAGWALVSVSPRGIPTEYFGLFTWPHIGFLHDIPIADRREKISAFVATHNLLAFLAAALIVLHVAGALYHMMRRDGTMARILPSRSSSSGNQS
jgi:cytochrome b561